MSTGATSAWRWLERRQVDRLAAGAGLLLALAMVPLRFVLSTVYAETFPLALLAGCALYLLARHTATPGGHITLSPAALRVLGAATFLGLSTMVVLAALQGRRSPQFYDVAMLTTGALLVQILFADDADRNPTFILAQVVTLALVIRGAALYTTPGYIGIDVWTHTTGFVAGIVDTNSLAAIEGKYSMAPFYHLLVAVAAMVGDVAIRTALYATVALVVPLGSLLVYATAREFVSTQWSLLAVALYVIGDDVIEWSIHPIPTSLGLLLFLAGLFLLVRYLKGHNGTTTVVPLVMVLAAASFTHQVSAFILLVTLGIGAFTQLALGNRLLYPGISTRNALGLFVFHAGLLSIVWSITPYRDGTFTGAMVRQIRRTVETDAGLFQLSGNAASATGGGTSPVAPIVATIAQYAEILGLVTLFTVTVAGSLYVLHHRRAEQATVTLVGAIVAMMVYSLGLPIVGINSFVPGRWIAFLYAPMAVIGVIGLGYFLRELPRPLGSAVAITLVVLYPTGMLLSTTATLDNPVFDDMKPKVAFTEAELASMETLGQHASSDAQFRSDSPYVNVLQRSQDVDAAMAAVPRGQPIPHQTVVYRPYQSRSAPIFARNGSTAIIRTTHVRMCGGRSQVYDNGAVNVCVR